MVMMVMMMMTTWQVEIPGEALVRPPNVLRPRYYCAGPIVHQPTVTHPRPMRNHHIINCWPSLELELENILAIVGVNILCKKNYEERYKEKSRRKDVRLTLSSPEIVRKEFSGLCYVDYERRF